MGFPKDSNVRSPLFLNSPSRFLREEKGAHSFWHRPPSPLPASQPGGAAGYPGSDWPFLSLERMLFRRRPRYQTAPALQRLLLRSLDAVLHSPWVLVLPFSLGVSHPHTDDDWSSSPTSLRQYPKPPPEGSRDQPCADYRSRCRASACHRGPQRWGWGKRRAECLLGREEISIGGLEGDTKAMRTVWEGKDVLGHRALGFTYTPNCVSTPPSALTPAPSASIFSLDFFSQIRTSAHICLPCPTSAC